MKKEYVFIKIGSKMFKIKKLNLGIKDKFNKIASKLPKFKKK